MKGTKTGGRTKGTPNKITGTLRDMILETLEKKGGVAYLEKQADENPTAFITLLAKVLPTQLTGDRDDPNNRPVLHIYTGVPPEAHRGLDGHQSTPEPKDMGDK